MTTTIGDAKRQVSVNKALCTRVQHIHILSCNGNDDINYGNEVNKSDNEASYIAPQDGDDVNNYGDEVNKVNNEASYITLPDGQQQ